ncbi:hypothetical protein APF79_02250 [bacterium BRH_c32]|nr:MAG: hypothetical protein APF79_02250 [bacterium BRH_c32]
MLKKIALFPLKLVIFPNAEYALHIFEERYKIMINNCIENNEPFGIVLSSEDKMETIGCKVMVNQVVKRYEDGKLDIIVKGTERFHIVGSEFSEHGYLIAEIHNFYDILDDNIDFSIYTDIKEKFNNILKLTELNLSSEYWSNLNRAPLKSFKIGEKAGLTLKQRQTILSLQSENARLELIKEHLIKIDNLIDKKTILRDLIQRDGYIN